MRGIRARLRPGRRLLRRSERMDAHQRAGAAPDREPSEPDVAPGFAPQAIGSYLRRQRELRGISAEELARSTRIPLRSLERLEAGSFDGEVDGFVRGFVRTVAAALGLDPDETVSRMLTEQVVEDTPEAGASNALPRALVGLAAVAFVALVVGLVGLVASTGEQTPAGGAVADDVVYRLDPVRALAEAQAGTVETPPGPVAAPPPPADPGTAASTP